MIFDFFRKRRERKVLKERLARLAEQDQSRQSLEQLQQMRLMRTPLPARREDDLYPYQAGHHRHVPDTDDNPNS